MRFVKILNHNENAVQLVDRVNKVDNRLLMAGMVVSFLLAAGFVMLIIFGRAFVPAIIGGCIGGAVFGVVGGLCLTLSILQKKYPYSVVLDDEHLFIKTGRKYLRFYKLDFQTVTYRGADGETSSARGNGTAVIEITNARITIDDSKGVRLRCYIRSGQKLAYILLQTAQDPKSGVNWGTAYDSLAEGKRNPNNF